MKIPVFVLSVDDVGTALKAKTLDPTFEMTIVSPFSADMKADLMRRWKDTPPGVIVTIHSTFEPFFCLNGLPYEYRRRWLHYDDVEKFNPTFVTNCYLGYIFNHTNDTNPLLSVFTTTFRSKQRLLRPFSSLLRQTYTNWEWVIVDDTDDKEDNTEHKNILKMIEHSDPRIRVYTPSRHCGIIGSMKKQACGLCRGEWLLEIDHDDEFVPDLFQWIVNAHRTHPNATFIYSDCIETFEDTHDAHAYGSFFGLGYGAYYTTLYKGRFQNVCTGCPINRTTMSHIVGVPNHIRCWRTSFYHQIGGHNEHLPVADDYELILRTVLHSDTWVRLADLGYIQYRNRNGNNFTFLRNQLIQDLVRLISHHYAEPLRQRFNFLLGKNEEGPVSYLSKPVYLYSSFMYPVLEKVMESSSPLFSIIIPTYNRPDDLRKALESVLRQTCTRWIAYIVGDACPALEACMTDLAKTDQYDPRFRWWNLSKNHGAGGAVPRNYALYLAQSEWIAYLDDDNTWEPNHLQHFVDTLALDTTPTDPDVAYAFSSFNVDGEPILTNVPVKGALDTSCVIHKRSLLFTYGLWKDRHDAGYAHDYEFFSRWSSEKYVATGQATMNYSTTYNEQSAESIRGLYAFNAAEYVAKGATPLPIASS
jgi:glycosyltransferase involved in cell wall biosynthesis